MVPDPKAFYDQAMPQKLGMDYEAARWKTNPLVAAQYDMLANVVRRLATPRVRSASRILEVGPGPGTWTKLLLESNPDASYTLVDISTEMLTQARTALAAHKNVSFTESDLAAYTNHESFDFFFSSRAIEYMPDKEGIARHIASLLRPGAEGVIITKMPKPFFERMRRADVSSLHAGQIGPGALTKYFHQAGLTVTEVRIATATVPGMRSVSLNRLAFSLLSRIPLIAPLRVFAESYAVTFRKNV
jgi:ubiquinone/menaquinone biosynthesis C-methylase UbiE